MTLPRLAIVGRPNVGKSSLINMVAARRVSIVDPTPGVTRDRVMAIVDLEGPDPRDGFEKVEIIDTGGYGVYTAEGRRIDNAGKDLAALTDDIEKQIGKAVKTADLILFVIDAQAGVTAQDEEIAKLLREGGMGHEAGSSGSKVLVIANKVDGPRWEAHALEASGMGFGEPLMVSAKNNYRRRELVETLFAKVRSQREAQLEGDKRAKKGRAKKAAAAAVREHQDEVRHAEMMLAIVGKRNAGKSTLVNTLAGEERMIVSEIAGTTRDAVDVRFEMDGKSFVAIDTAGLRKKKSFQDRIEWYALDRMKLAVERCDVAVLLIDATEPISQVDEHVAQFIARSYKPCVIVVNKWDLAQGRVMSGGRGRKAKRGNVVSTEAYEEYIRGELKGLWFAPISFVSAKSGLNVKNTIALAFELMNQSRERTTTGKLNRLVRGILDRQGPANKLGTFAKVMYVAQVRTSPPTIVCVVNKPELFTANYQRFLLNRFREELPFPEVPIRLLIRGRKQDEEFDSSAESRLASELESGELTQVMPLGTEGFSDDEGAGELLPAGAPDNFSADEIEAMFDDDAEATPIKKEPEVIGKGRNRPVYKDPTRKPKSRGGPKRVRRRTSPGR